MGRLEVPSLLLDGEIAVFDRQLLSRFEWLRGRPPDEPATLIDCIYARGKDLRKRPLRVRRNVLEKLMDESGRIRWSSELAELTARARCSRPTGGPRGRWV